IHLFHILRKSHDSNDRVSSLHAVRDCLMENGSLADHILDLCLCPRIDVKLISCFHEVADHGLSHDPDPDKPDLSHMYVLAFSCSLFSASAFPRLLTKPLFCHSQKTFLPSKTRSKRYTL